MRSSSTLPWGALALLAAGALALVRGGVELATRPDALADYGPSWLDALLAPMGALVLIGLASIRTRYARGLRARRGLLMAMVGFAFVALAGSSAILPVTGILSGIGFLVVLVGVLVAALGHSDEFPTPLRATLMAVAIWPVAIFGTGGLAQLAGSLGATFGWRSVMQVLLHALTPGLGALWIILGALLWRRAPDMTTGDAPALD